MKRTTLCPWAILLAAGCVSLGCTLQAQEAHTEGSQPPLKDSVTGQQTRTSAIRAKIDIQNGRLSVAAKEVPLGWLLQKLSDKLGVSIVAQDLGREKVSLVASNASLEQVLRRLLQKYDYFIYYGGDSPSLSAVWVYPKGQGRGIEPVPAGQWASTKEFERQLTDNDPEVRASAIEAVIERKGEGATDEILAALNDENERVRTQALYYSQTNAVELPTAVLAGLATSDPSANVRYLALEALAGSSEGESVARAALNDPDPNVQAAANEILGQAKNAVTEPSKH
jgi:type II secretory pathway component GspD/PulD (secretin)